MRPKLAIKEVLLFLLMPVVACGQVACQQAVRHPTSVIDLFNQEASASDPAGIHKYAADLIDLLVPPGVSDETREEVIDALTDRLARAEESARAGHGKLVAEASVIRAFNDLMGKVGAPASLRATEDSLWKYRQHAASIKAFSTLFTADRNGKSCNPGEAVFLLYILLWTDGNPTTQDLDSAQVLLQRSKQRNCCGAGQAASRIWTAPTAQWLIYLYSWRHNCGATRKLFNQVADIFGL